MIGDKIKQIRKSKNISQKDFAKILNIPVSTLANYENNHREPNLEMLKKISNALDVSVDNLADTINISEDLCKAVNKKYYNNISIDDIEHLLSLRKTYFNSKTFKNASNEEKEKFINNLANINPLFLKIENYINNFDNFTKEDLLSISNELFQYGNDLVNCFLTNYYEPEVNDLNNKINELHNKLGEALDLINEVIEDKNDMQNFYKNQIDEVIKVKDTIIESYKEQFDKIINLLNSFKLQN